MEAKIIPCHLLNEMWSGKKESSDMIIILFGIGKNFEIVTISMKGRHVLS
jgi:hypothetical protein